MENKLANLCPSHGWIARRSLAATAAVGLALALGACQPTVKIEAPDEPIVINLNIKIEQEVRVKIDRALDDVISDNPSIFE